MKKLIDIIAPTTTIVFVTTCVGECGDVDHLDYQILNPQKLPRFIEKHFMSYVEKLWKSGQIDSHKEYRYTFSGRMGTGRFNVQELAYARS